MLSIYIADVMLFVEGNDRNQEKQANQVSVG